MKTNVEAQKTPWFDNKTKPYRVGWYEVLYYPHSPVMTRFWSNCFWYLDGDAKVLSEFGYPGDTWRGLASKP